MTQVLNFKTRGRVIQFMANRYDSMDENAIVAYVTNVLSPMVERGDKARAIEELTEIITNVCWTEKPLAIASALGIRIVAHKHMWQNTENKAYLGAMQADVCNGINLAIPDEVRAQFHLRDGDISSSIGDHAVAEMKYELAYRCVKKGGREEAEYLGHYGEALASNGKPRAGINRLQQALELMNSDPSGTPEHRLIVNSGLYGRLAKCAFKCGRLILAYRSYKTGRKMAEILAYQYNMPQRLNQYRLRLWGKGV